MLSAMARSLSSPEMRDHFALRGAVRKGSTDEVRALLDAGVDVEGPPGMTSPLALAAAIGSTEIVELLIDHSADPARVSRIGWSAATHADANGFPALARRLVDLGTPAESRLAHGYSDLHRGARRGDVASLLVGLEPAAIDAIDSGGDTPLSLAISHRNEAAVDALLEAGANPNHSNDGWWVLNEAVYQDARPGELTHFVGRLLAAGADLNPHGYPPLLCAVNQEWSSGFVLRQLVAAGADINAIVGRTRETVLHRIAAIVSDSSLTDTALDLGADIEARDWRGRTPLLSAADTANAGAFIRLVERGADVDARDTDGQSVHDLLDDSDDADAGAGAGAEEIRNFLAAATSLEAENGPSGH